jgi:Multimeric flavodoxin WrbA
VTIVAIISSPRKGANSETIVKAVIEGAKANGKDVKEFYLNSMTNAKGCQACMGCKKTGSCIIKDDNAEVLKAIREAEGVIISSPLYFSEAAGQFRLLQDRFYSFMGLDFAPNIAPGKKLVTVVTCGSGAENASLLADKMEGVMAGAFKFIPIGKIVASNCGAPDVAKNDSKVIEEAKSIGKKF